MSTNWQSNPYNIDPRAEYLVFGYIRGIESQILIKDQIIQKSTIFVALDFIIQNLN